MNKTGKIKETDTSQEFRQFSINSIGANDVGKYYLLSAFGEDSNIPENTKVLTIDSQNKDVNFIAGFLNKLKDNNLQKGEKIIFSTSTDGSEIKSFIKLLNDGTMQFNGDVDNIAGFTELKAGFDKLKDDLNNLLNLFNAHIHITTATVGATAVPGIISATTSQGTPSTANIDNSKKDNLKIE